MPEQEPSPTIVEVETKMSIQQNLGGLGCNSCVFSQEGYPCNRVASTMVFAAVRASRTYEPNNRVPRQVEAGLLASSHSASPEVLAAGKNACAFVLAIEDEALRLRASRCGIHTGICTGSLG